MATPSTPLPQTRRRRVALLALCLAGFVVQLDVTIVTVGLPTVQQAFRADPGALEWVGSGYALGLAALVPGVGALGDRLGHRPSCWVVSSSAAAPRQRRWRPTRPRWWARVGEGAGGAAVVALTLAVLTDTYPPDQRGRAIGWWAAIGGLGSGGGPVAGGLLLSSAGWSSIFWTTVPIVAVTAALVVLAVPGTTAAPEPRPLDVPGVALASVGPVSVTFGLITATAVPGDPARTVVSLVLGGLALAAFVQWQRRAREPLVPRAVPGLQRHAPPRHAAVPGPPRLVRAPHRPVVAADERPVPGRGAGGRAPRPALEPAGPRDHGLRGGSARCGSPEHRHPHHAVPGRGRGTRARRGRFRAAGPRHHPRGPARCAPSPVRRPRC